MQIKTIIRIHNISTDSANPHPFARLALLRSAAVCGEAATVFSRQIPTHKIDLFCVFFILILKM